MAIQELSEGIFIDLIVFRVERIDSPKACLSHLLFKFGVSVGQVVSRDIMEATEASLTIAIQLQIASTVHVVYGCRLVFLIHSHLVVPR